jgi:hypothetical protein
MQKSDKVPGAYYSANFANVTVVNSDVSSDYHSMQLQFTRRLSHGLQGIANYTWSHSIDTGSSDSSVNMPGYLYPLSSERGNSDFDIRHSFSAALTYDVPAPKWGLLSEAFLRNWSLNGIVSARTGLPYDVRVYEINALGDSQRIRRASLVPGQPIVISNPKAPGGWSLNNNVNMITMDDGTVIPVPVAFVAPPGTEQGNIGRNSLTGFGAWQMDLGIHRLFKLTEKTRLEFRAEMFNVLNHPNFGNPYSEVNYNILETAGNGLTALDPRFGYSQSSLAYSNGSGFSPVFGTGGHRDIQFALKLSF